MREMAAIKLHHLVATDTERGTSTIVHARRDNIGRLSTWFHREQQKCLLLDHLYNSTAVKQSNICWCPHQLVRHDNDLRHPPVEVLFALAYHHDLLFRYAFFVQPLEQFMLPMVSRRAG